MSKVRAKFQLPKITAMALTFLFGAVALAESNHHVNASTPSEHAEAAEHYKTLAEAARQNVRSHHEQRMSYERNSLRNLSEHCKTIAKKFEELAEEYDAMAAEHAFFAGDQ